MSINGTLLHTPGIVGVWNVSQYSCVDFRREVVRKFFVLWPEMLNGVFNYCCEDGASHYSLTNFTYGLHQGQLDPRPYFDLGVVETFLPYWHFWTFWQVPTKSISFPLHCDYTDMHSLYVRRFWNKIIVLGAKTGAVLVGILESAVLFCVVCLWQGPFTCLHPLIGNLSRCKILEGWFCTSEYADVISEWAHLILLALIGGCMMEAIGHSSLHGWRASVMYNAGAVYSYLTAMAILSSLFRQCAMFSLPRQAADALPDTRDNAGVPGQVDGNAGVPGQVHGNAGVPGQVDGNAGVPGQVHGNAGVPGQVHGNAGVPGQVHGNAGVPGQVHGNAGVPGQVHGNAGVPGQVHGNAGVPGQVAYRLPDIPGIKTGKPGRAWKTLKKIGDDWRWQKVFAQFGVLILMGTYLALVDTDDGVAMDSVAGIVLAAVVAACIWSAGAAFLVFYRSALFMILMYKSLYN